MIGKKHKAALDGVRASMYGGTVRHGFAYVDYVRDTVDERVVGIVTHNGGGRAQQAAPKQQQQKQQPWKQARRGRQPAAGQHKVDKP